MTSRPVRTASVADALPPRTHFDSEQWLNARQPSRKGTWIKRGGAVLVTALLGALGWVGYQQIPAAAAKSDATTTEDSLVLQGETAGDTDASSNFVPATAVSDTAGPLEPSPFDAPQSFHRMSAPVAAAEPPANDPGDNPFAAFAPKQTAMTPEESPFDNAPSQINPAPRPATAEVTLASNEAPAASAVEIFGVAGQSEPATNAAPGQSEPIPSADNDPFAAFASPPVPGTDAASYAPEQASGEGQPPVVVDLEAPGPATNISQSSPAVDDAWATAPPPSVTPAQFSPDPAQFAAPAQFEPAARPIPAANEFAAEPAPALNRAPVATDWPPFEQRPASIEPRAFGANPQPVYSPAAEPAQATSFDIPQPATPANDPRDEKLHVVQQGETYWSIARQHYGAGRYFQALADYNKPRISDQASLKPGMKVLVPSAATLDVRYGKAMQASGLAKPPAKPQAGLRIDPQGRPLYVVGPGDTLGEIARRYLGKTSRSDEISRLNQEQLPNPNRLKDGMILVMPDDAAEVHPASSIPSRR